MKSIKSINHLREICKSLSIPVCDETPGTVVGADVEGLALGGGVGVVAALHQPVAAEAGVGDLGEDGVVLARHPGDVDLQPPVTRPGLISGPGVAAELSSPEGDNCTEH